MGDGNERHVFGRFGVHRAGFLVVGRHVEVVRSDAVELAASICDVTGSPPRLVHRRAKPILDRMQSTSYHQVYHEAWALQHSLLP